MLAIIGLYIYAFFITFVSALAATYVCRKIALRLKVIAYPKKERLHEEPIPLLGGVAIVFSFYFCLGLNYVFLRVLKNFSFDLPQELLPYVDGALARFPYLAVILFCGALMFLLGLIDDLKVLGPIRKIFFQVLVGVFLYYNDIRISLFMEEGFLSLFVTVIWIVGITNAFNLLDNIDGLSAGVAIIASCILLILCVQGQQILVSLLLVFFIGALAGFLRFNYQPASIFMGDAGSLFIGYVLSVLTIMSTFHYSKEISIIPIAAPLLIFAVPIYDTVSVMGIRLKNGKSLFSGDKNHFSHRLLRLGMSQRGTVLFIYLVSLCLGISALALSNANVVGQYVLLFHSVGLLLIIYLLEREKK
jgi:UDP-GlcNAc:undecaprenyl-phosphate/decaprenyl-phosphate GlcNAc-1-phosphate transferase